MLLEEGVLPSWAEKEDLRKEEMESVRQDDEAKRFPIMSSRGDAFAIIESYETAYQLFQALKAWYETKKTTTKLKKCYMKPEIDNPYL